MATVNLHNKYNVPLAKAFEFSSIFGGKTSTEYSFTGANSIVVTAMTTSDLTNYNREASGSRYGTTSEVDDTIQTMTLSKDRSFSKAIDKGNYQEQNYLKTGAAYSKQVLDEKVGPEIEQHIITKMDAGAGTSITKSAAPTKTTVVEMLADLEVALDDAFVPKTDRYVCMPNAYVAMLRQALQQCNDITDKMLLKGIVGQFGSLHVLGVPTSYMPTNTHMIAWQKGSVIAPKTIDDIKVSTDAPGVSGLLIEGRFRYDAFVLTKRNLGVAKIITE